MMYSFILAAVEACPADDGMSWPEAIATSVGALSGAVVIAFFFKYVFG